MEAESVPIIGISRHRIGVDGNGVTTLVAFHGCPLDCKYCLNKACKEPAEKFYRYTPEQLFQKVAIDNLYFMATGGGICFGGGEPLLRVDFIEQFKELCGDNWHITAETSLAVAAKNVRRSAAVIDDYIVDIKDCNPDIYKAYTGRSNRMVLKNLELLLKKVGPEHIIVRVPSIPKFNRKTDVKKSIAQLTAMGVTNIDQFKYLIR